MSAVVAAAAVICLVIVLLTAGGQQPQPRARQYLAFTACMLTDANGVAGASAAPAWAGMEDASLETHAKVEYLPVMPGSTADAAAPILASLVARQCGVIVAAGQVPVAAVLADAHLYRSVRFAVVATGTAGFSKTAAPNVMVVAGSAGAIRSAVDGLVRAAVTAG